MIFHWGIVECLDQRTGKLYISKEDSEAKHMLNLIHWISGENTLAGNGGI